MGSPSFTVTRAEVYAPIAENPPVQGKSASEAGEKHQARGQDDVQKGSIGDEKIEIVIAQQSSRGETRRIEITIRFSVGAYSVSFCCPVEMPLGFQSSTATRIMKEMISL